MQVREINWEITINPSVQLSEDPSFKPSGGRLGENDMDYDTDEKSMAALRRQLRIAREEYYRCKRYHLLLSIINYFFIDRHFYIEFCSAYMTYVMEALELEDTIKNYDRLDSTGWSVKLTLN